MNYRYWVIGGVFLCASIVMAANESSEAEAVTPTPPIVDQQLLKDLSRIRQKVGGSVLRGSSLEDSTVNPDQTFEAGVRTLLERQEAVLPVIEKASTDELRPDEEPNSLSHNQRLGETDAVKQLRLQCVKLDRIANELEHLRNYRQADEVRASATALRLLARQLDKRAPIVDEPNPSMRR